MTKISKLHDILVAYAAMNEHNGQHLEDHLRSSVHGAIHEHYWVKNAHNDPGALNARTQYQMMDDHVQPKTVDDGTAKTSRPFDFADPYTPIGDTARREKLAIFGPMVAGKRSVQTQKVLDKLLGALPEAPTPFGQLKAASDEQLEGAMRAAGTGQYGRFARTFRDLQNLDLTHRNPSLEEWEGVHGISHKTSRFIAMNMDKDAQTAALDVHVLRWLRSQGHDAPEQTPGSPAVYRKLENVVLDEAKKRGMTPREFDLMIWKQGAMAKPEES